MAHSIPLDSIKVFGTDPDGGTCEHCGRPELKKLVVLSVDDGPLVRFGTGCAATALKVGVVALRKAAAQADKLNAAAAQAELAKTRAAHDKAWTAFLAPHGAERLEAIEALGGFAAASQAFKDAQK